MAAIHHYREAIGATVTFDEPLEASIRAGELGLAVDAVLASAATCGVVVDDPDGALAILGKQRWEVDEDAAPASSVLTGTVAKTSGLATLVGTGTSFLAELSEGDELVVPGGGGTEYLFVETVTDNTHVDVWVEPVHSASGQTVTVAGRQRMWSGRTGRKVIRRGLDRAEGGEIFGAGRSWSIDLIERNGYFHSRIPHTDGSAGSDNWNRPLETMAVRLAFIVASDIFADLEVFDDGFVDYPTFTLDAADYRGRFLDEVLNELAQQSNNDLAKPARRNIGSFYHEAAGHFALWFRTLEAFAYPSRVRISNVDADKANANTYMTLATPEPELEQDPESVAGRVIVVISRRFVVRELASTEVIYGPWDALAPNSNLKSVAAGQAYGDAELLQSQAEDETWTGRILMPAAKVNDVKEFQQVRLRQSHMPGYATERWMRVVHRDIKEATANGAPAPWLYDVGLKLSPAFQPGAHCNFAHTPSQALLPLGFQAFIPSPEPQPSDGIQYYASTSPIATGSYATYPNPGVQGFWFFGNYSGQPGYAYSPDDQIGDGTTDELRFVLVGDGTLNITIGPGPGGGAADTFKVYSYHSLTASLDEATYSPPHLEGTFTAGDPVSVVLTGAVGPNCIHIVKLVQFDRPGHGGSSLYAGATWAAA